MSDLKLSEIMSMQKELHEKYKGKWSPLSVENGRSCLLWMIEEMGEAISIIKKRGENAIMNDETVRAAFVEELVDMMMFYNDALICYGITPNELSEAFVKKHLKNMGRDFIHEHKSYLNSK
jgi:NTP pyrophosphatase (non-canonical NTP hydrolase)